MCVTPPDPGATVVLVSHGQAEELSACLETLGLPLRDAEGFPCQVIVVDNASPDDAPDRAEALGAELIRFPENLGFARAANAGLLRARGEFTVFLNPDARLTERGLRLLCAALRSDEELGLVAPSLVNLDDGRPQASSFPFPSWRDFLGRQLFGRGQPAPEDEPRWFLGACLAGRSDALRRWGGFDEDFFLYGEDMELCWRVLNSGKRLRMLSRVLVSHRGNPHWTADRLARVHHAQIRFFRKTRGPLEGEALSALVRLRYGLRALGSDDAAMEARVCLKRLTELLRADPCAS